MADYNGEKCIVCGLEFKADDDIVVCPDCGTPYHRECYMKEGKCVNTELHDKKESWKPQGKGGKASPEQDAVCTKCGYKNPPLALFCEKCGAPLNSLDTHNENMRAKTAPLHDDSDPKEYNKSFMDGAGIEIKPFLVNFSDPLCGLNPEEDYDGVRLCELADYVESNTHYYLPLFKRMKDTGSLMSWNFSAMLFPEFYFANRKMPFAALGIFLVRLAAYAPNVIAVMAQLNDKIAGMIDLRSTAFHVVTILCYALIYAMMFFCGAFANGLYYRKAVRGTAKIKASVPPQQLRQTLRRKGGTSAALLTIAIVIGVLLYSLIPMLAVWGVNI